MPIFDLIAFDADDTLWHNERLYTWAQDDLARLLSQYAEPAWIQGRLYQTEMRNMQHYGYGIKAFTLSMIETAVELTDGRVTGQDIGKIIEIARKMLNAEIDLLPDVAETVAALAGAYPLMMITKGDLLEQERKIVRSGIGQYFKFVEVVSDKTPENYDRRLLQHGFDPARVLMVGNSVRSDILPVLALGGWAVYIPYQTTWAHEIADLPPAEQHKFYQLERLPELPALLARLEQEQVGS